MDHTFADWTGPSAAVTVLVLTVWAAVAWRERPGAAALILGMAHVAVAGLHVAAPFAALLDPRFPGYEFGFLRGGAGALTAALTGAVFILAVVGAFAALGRGKRARLRVAATSTLFAVNLGGAWLHNMLAGVHDGARPVVDIASVPGGLPAGLGLALLVAPFLFGAVWAGRRALLPA